MHDIEHKVSELEAKVNALKLQINEQKINFNKALQEIEFLAWTFLFATYALKLFGINVETPNIENDKFLTLIQFVDSNNMVRLIITVIMNCTVLNFIYMTVLKRKYTVRFALQLNVFIIPFQILYVGVREWNNESIIFFILTVVPYFIILIFNKSIKQFALFVIIDTFMQVISAVTKVDIISYNSLFTFIVVHLDYCLMWAIKFIRQLGGKQWDGLLVDGAVFWKNVLTKSWQELKSITITLKTVPTRLKKRSLRTWCVYLKARLKIFVKCELKLLITRSVLPKIIVFGIYFGYAYFVDKFLQAVFLYIAYLHLRKLFPKHFHADYIPNIKKNYISITCICLSSLMLCTALYNVIGGGLSVISSIIVAFVVDWMLYVIRDWLDRLASDPVIMELLKWFNKEERLKKKCADVNMSALLTEICIDWKINKLSRQQQADKYGYALNTIRKYRNDIENLLKTK